MATLVFDIETVGESWDDMDTLTQETLSRWIDRTSHSDDVREAALKDLKNGLGFSPLTGRIVAIGVYDHEREKGVVFFDPGSGRYDDVEEGQFAFLPRSEETMLKEFWEGARSYDTFVTFNGRAFDVPYLAIRSAIRGVRQTQDLNSHRYLSQQHSVRHIDLQDQLSFYGAVPRRSPLHLYCRAFGIDSPKQEGVTGDDVATLVSEGRHRDVAHYNARDVISTHALYERWLAHLAPPEMFS